ncbi:MAG: TetR/AcrR family transcriptional regulator [Anaerolineales bacterium]|nr:TetR/AcrR family transcriptional regulator [Anaerolineales bacterium]
MSDEILNHIPAYIRKLEEEGWVTRTFRRLDPPRQIAVIEAILIEAAHAGPSSLNIKKVAQRAGVSVGSLYTYFPDRDGMLAFAVELSVRIINDSFNEYRPYLSSLPLREALKAYLIGGVEWSTAQAGFLRLFARAAYQGDPELAETLVKPIANTLLDMVREILQQAILRREIRPDVDLEAASRLVHALTIAAGDSLLLPYLNHYFQVTSQELPIERMVEALVELICQGIATANQHGVSP